MLRPFTCLIEIAFSPNLVVGRLLSWSEAYLESGSFSFPTT
jgi:hypothetical protein